MSLGNIISGIGSMGKSAWGAAGRASFRGASTMLNNPRATMAMAGAAGGYAMGGFEGALAGAGMGAVTPKGMVNFGKRAASSMSTSGRMGFTGSSWMKGLGGRVVPGMVAGGAAGFGANIALSGMSSVGSNVSNMNKPYSSFGGSYGSSMGSSPYGTSFSGMGRR